MHGSGAAEAYWIRPCDLAPPRRDGPKLVLFVVGRLAPVGYRLAPDGVRVDRRAGSTAIPYQTIRSVERGPRGFGGVMLLAPAASSGASGTSGARASASTGSLSPTVSRSSGSPPTGASSASRPTGPGTSWSAWRLVSRASGGRGPLSAARQGLR